MAVKIIMVVLGESHMKRLASKKTPPRCSKAAFVLTFQQTFRSCLTLPQTSSYLKEAYLGPNQTFMMGLCETINSFVC